MQVRQYTLAGVLGTWAAAALPMGALAWLGAPLARPAASTARPRLPRALILVLTAGLVWQFLLVLVLVYREQRSLRWSVLKDALWLHAPRRPKTGRRGGRAWLIMIPLVFALAAEEMLPTLPTPGYPGHGAVPRVARRAHVPVRQLGLVRHHRRDCRCSTRCSARSCCSAVCCCPGCRASFGRWDWAANGVLFAVYHLHVPWVIPQAFVDICVPYAAKRYRSALVGIAVHSVQSVFFTVLVLALVLK